MFLLAKQQGNAKESNTAKQLQPKLVTAGQRSIELASSSMWQYLG